MNTDRHRWKRKLQKLILGLLWGLGIYVGVYLLDSFFGGYWLMPEMDGKDRYSAGLAMTDGILWQPCLGHESLGNWDYAGEFFLPLIRLDRKFIHPSRHFFDKEFEAQYARLKVSQVHPHWRDEFSTTIKISAVIDGQQGKIICTLHYTGSSHPREIYEIVMRKSFADAIAASPPAGFTAKPYEGNPARQNQFLTRWVGKIALRLNQDVTVNIPAKHPKADQGHISFRYQRMDNRSEDYKNFSSITLK